MATRPTYYHPQERKRETKKLVAPELTDLNSEGWKIFQGHWAYTFEWAVPRNSLQENILEKKSETSTVIFCKEKLEFSKDWDDLQGLKKNTKLIISCSFIITKFLVSFIMTSYDKVPMSLTFYG